MYFCRFDESILMFAQNHEAISDAQYVKIKEFWYKNYLYITEDVSEFFNSLNIEFKILSEDKIQITKWPHFPKIMYLTMCKRKPNIWKYEDEKENFLFGYIISENDYKFYKDKDMFLSSF